MHKKLQESMRQGVILERDRVMRICTMVTKRLQADLSKKLMTAQEKHLAELKFKVAEAVVAAVQIKIMSAEDPDAKATTSDLHRPDSPPVGPAQGDPDRPGA
jgi:hypothetical protein